MKRSLITTLLLILALALLVPFTHPIVAQSPTPPPTATLTVAPTPTPPPTATLTVAPTPTPTFEDRYGKSIFEGIIGPLIVLIVGGVLGAIATIIFKLRPVDWKGAPLSGGSAPKNPPPSPPTTPPSPRPWTCCKKTPPSSLSWSKPCGAGLPNTQTGSSSSTTPPVRSKYGPTSPQEPPATSSSPPATRPGTAWSTPSPSPGAARIRRLPPQTQGEIQSARKAYERALAIFERFLGPDHQYTRGVQQYLDNLPQE